MFCATELPASNFTSVSVIQNEHSYSCLLALHHRGPFHFHNTMYKISAALSLTVDSKCKKHNGQPRLPVETLNTS